MRYKYRREPGRLVLALTEMDLGDRLPVDQARFLTLDLGRMRAIVPPPLDFDQQGAFAPVKVISDPDRGRVWEPIQWTDTGRSAELWTPMSGTL